MDFYSWGQLEHVWVLISCRALMLWLLSLIKLYCFCLCKFSSDVCCSPHVIVQPFFFFNLKTFPFQGSRPAHWAQAAERAVKVRRVFTIQSLLTTWGAYFGQRTVWTVMINSWCCCRSSWNLWEPFESVSLLRGPIQRPGRTVVNGWLFFFACVTQMSKEP